MFNVQFDWVAHNVPGLGEVGFIVGLARWANPPCLARVSHRLLFYIAVILYFRLSTCGIVVLFGLIRAGRQPNLIFNSFYN